MRISDWSSDVCSSDLKNGIETKADSAYFKVAKDYTPTSPWSFNATYTYTKAVENRFFGETFAFDFPDFDGGLRFIRLKTDTGEKLAETKLDDRHPETGADIQDIVQVQIGRAECRERVWQYV